LRINRTEELGDKLIRKKYFVFLTIQKQWLGNLLLGVMSQFTDSALKMKTVVPF